MAFSHKEPCPRCRKNGGDTSGDNLIRYTNGSAFCFACRYMEKPTSWTPPEKKEHKGPPTDLTSHFHQYNLNWLRKYLNDTEIIDHFLYSPSMRRHVYMTGEYWEARSVNKMVEPKVISHGVKPFILFGAGDPVVIVEDVVSAIKVGRVATALPLFGAYCPTDWMARIARMRPNTVVFWLDKDKALDARDYATKYNLLCSGKARGLTTEADPKCYQEDDLKRFLQIKDPYD